MSDGRYIMGLDVGDRHVGVAIASSIARLAGPLETVDRDDHSRLLELIKVNDVSAIVVGLPRDMNGNETEQTLKTRHYINGFKELNGLDIFWQDESVTSIKAEERLRSRGKPYKKSDIDSESACVILEDYLIKNQYGDIA